MPLTPPPLALYVHLPWCVRKCPYCDFNSHAVKGETPYADYIDALIRDLEFDLPLVWGRTVHSVFFGGGTPSLFAPEFIDDFMQRASARLRIAPDAEVTLETNPGTVEHGPFKGYLAAGVNRLSFGVQSFDDGCLQRLGRIHSSGDVDRAIQSARDAGYDNFNIDLMCALPGQDMAMALHDVERALAFSPTHLSHYELTLEPNTAFAARPPEGLPSHDDAADIQDACHARLKAAGFQHYETSAFAQPGRACQHNLNYWQFGDYLGIGAGAHGKITSGAEQHVLRRWKHKHPTQWMAHAGTEAAIGGDEILSEARLPFDFMLNALRLTEGFSIDLFQKRTGLPLSVIAPALKQAVDTGGLLVDASHVTPTPQGRRFLNDILALFI